MGVTTCALALLAVGVVAAVVAVSPRRPWPLVCAGAMLVGSVLMLRSPTTGTLSLVAAGFLVVTAVESVRWVRAVRTAGGGWDEPLVGWGCAAAMFVMALTMRPMPGMTHDNLAAGLGPTPLVVVLGLVAVGGVAAVVRVGRAAPPAGVAAPAVRHHACTVAHLAMCAGMGLPLLFAS